MGPTMSRYGNRHRLDSNHRQIVDNLNELGFGVISTAQCGGFPGDIMVAYKGSNYLIEIKPSGWKKPRNKREKSQAESRCLWCHLGGQTAVATTIQEVLEILGVREHVEDYEI